MHAEVVSFIKFLNDNMSKDMRLRMILLRVDTLKTYYIASAIVEKKNDLREQLQQFTDLFAHVYKGREPRDFGSIRVIDNMLRVIDNMP